MPALLILFSYFDLSLGRITDSIAIPDSQQGDKSVTFTANNGLILRQDSSIIRWDSTRSKVSRLNFSKEGTSSAVQFLPAKDSLVVGNNRGEVFMVSMDGDEDDREPTDHLAHTSVVTDIAVSPDGKWVATSSNDNTIVIWDQHTWRPLRLTPEALNTSHSFVNSVSFSPEGDYVYAGYEDGTILRWPISMDILSRLICEKVDQKLSNDEWEKYTKGIIDKEDIYDCQ